MHLRGSTVRGNTAFFGGGIANQATLDITDSTVSGNSARIHHGGGLTNCRECADQHQHQHHHGEHGRR